MHYSVLTVLIIAMAMAGCEKDDNGNGPDKATLLTSHIWKYDSFSTSETDPDILLVVNFFAAAYTGSTINLNSDGTYVFTSQDETDDGTWELSADGTKMITDKGTEDETEHTIVTLTSDVFEHTFTEDFELGLGSVDITLKWVK